MFHGTLNGAYYSHLMGHKSSFSEMIMAGRQVDLGIKLGRIKGPIRKGEGESSRKIASAATPTGGRRSKEASVNAVNAGHNAPQQYSHLHWPRNKLSIITLPFLLRPRSTDLRLRELLSRRNRPQPHRMIDEKKLVFNVARPPNVQANPFPDHGSSSRPTINMINVDTIGEYEANQEGPSPFVIEYVPPKTTVGFTGFGIAPTPFVIEIPAMELYQDSKVPWTYEGSGGNLEQQFSVMGVTRSGRVYENPEAARKGKAPTMPGVSPEALSIPQKKVTKEEVEAFMKIIKVSEYKVVEQMANLLLGRPWIHAAGAVPSSLHQRIKFITEGRLITVKGEEDYAIYKEMAVPYVSIGDDENLPFHSFETISVIRDYGKVGPSCADRMVGKILLRHNYIPGTGLGAHGTLDGPSSDSDSEPVGLPNICAVTEETTPGAYIRLAQENEELNNWTSVPRYSTVIADVPHSNLSLRRIDSNPSEELLEESRPIYFGEGLDEDGRVPEIEESLRHLENRQLTSVEPTEEININAGFLEVCNYFEWAANIVPVEKKDGRVRVCVDYQDLDKASPKDNFPLPHIDVLVDNTARHTLFSFMDGFSGAMVTLFHDMMHKKIEVYVDDMIAKSKKGEDHLVNLKRLFGRLKKYKLRLNPTKCTFSAKSGKLLGFVVSERGIEVDPDKRSSQSKTIHRSTLTFRTKGSSKWIVRRTNLHGRCISTAQSTGSGIGAVLISPDGRYYPIAAKVDFPCTNNVAEYEACILGLQAAIDFKVRELEVFGDSMLTIFQMLGEWKTRDEKLVSYHEYLEELAENFEKISFTYTPLIKNQFADALATLASMVSITKENLIEPLEIEIAKGLAHCDAIEATDEQPWYEDIKQFLQTVTANAVARFLKRDIIARYGVPETIITDNAKNLNNK
ncbi:hypothetical protein CRG98_026001, partial [Punica granatum]